MEPLDTLSSLSVGSRFRKADLHVHTPASPDLNENWTDATPDDVVRLALDAGLELIAITDHNTASWCDAVRTAASGTELTVLPGVEISTSEGHLLAIFDVDKPQREIEEFLANVGIRGKDLGDTDKIAEGGIDQVAQAIEREGGVAIAAHIEKEKGFWKQLERSKTRRKKVHECEQIRAYEVVDAELRDGFQEGSRSGYKRTVACIQSSDCFPARGDSHELDAIGRRYCYVSLDEVTIAGLRLAFLDPEVRIRLMDDERRTPGTVIEGMWVSGGFLTDTVFRFSNNITCLIGDTGSGKSLTLELLRYALDQQVNSEVLPNIAKEVRALLDSNLESPDTVQVVVRKGDERYLIERPWLATNPPAPTVSRLVSNRPVPLDDPIDVPTFVPVKGFSQTEIIEYAREPLARLSLIDDLIDLGIEATRIEELKRELRENAADLIAQLEALEKAEGRLKALPGIQEEIKRLSGYLTNSAVRRHAAWTNERDVLEAAAESVAALGPTTSDSLPALETSLVEDDDLPDDTPSERLHEELTNLDAEIQSALAKTQKDAQNLVAGFATKLKKIRAAWEKTYEVAEEAYQEVVADLETTERTQATLQKSLESQEAKERRLKRDERKIEQDIKPAMNKLEEDRDTWLRELRQTRKAMTVKRQAKAEELSKTLNRRVLIRVKGQKDGREFLNALTPLAEGSYTREADLATMADELDPGLLVQSLISNDIAAPAKESGLSEGVFRKLIATIRDKKRIEGFLELQLVDLPDVVEVQFAVETGVYKDLEKLAHGQKSTVVLMIALAEGGFPLLADQPEDALHAPWIEEHIVTTLRAHRGTRQCLFATRSANVLVSADAEQIIAMKADATAGGIDKTGGLDRFETRDLVLYHVEGGPDPLKRRLQKYDL